LEKRSDLEVEDSQNEFLSRIQIYKDYMNKLSKTNLTEIVPYPFVYRLYGPESKFKKIIFKVYSIFS
jgi:hypothetical protein